MSIEQWEPTAAPAVAAPAPRSTIDNIVTWAESARAAHQVATSLVGTSFVPESFRGKPHEATAAILSGAEVGLSPMASLRSFAIIQGTAAPGASTLRAIVQNVGHDVWVVEQNDTRAVVAGRRRGSNHEQRSTWTIDRAKKMGLTGKKNWQSQPQAMLVARATSEVCRLIASDAILGMPYTAEELGDDGPEPTGPTTPADTPRRAQRTRRPTVKPELETDPDGDVRMSDTNGHPNHPSDPAPPLPGEDGYQDDDGDHPKAAPAMPDATDGADDNTITTAQLKMLHASFSELGITDRDERLATASAAVGRDLATSKDLTRQEASDLIDALADQRAAGAPDDER